MYVSVLDIDEIIENENSKYKGAEKEKVYKATEDLASLTGEEIQLINLRLGAVAENEAVFAVLWSVREAVYEVVRSVKANLKTSEAMFVGEFAEGKQLDLDIIRYYDVKKSGTALSSWIQSVTAGTAYFESDTDNNKLTLNDWEGRVYAGWADPIDSPKLVSVEYMLTMKNIIIATPFELNKEYPIIRHRAIKLLPNDSYAIQVRYSSDGDDAARPVAVRIITAEKKEL